jgi:hypothetical protein
VFQSNPDEQVMVLATIVHVSGKLVPPWWFSNKPMRPAVGGGICDRKGQPQRNKTT